MTTPAGWYPPNPDRPEHLRYWDGEQWTEHVHDPLATASKASGEAAAVDAAPGADANPAMGLPGDQQSGNWFVRHKVVTGVIGVAGALLVIGLLAGGDEEEPTAVTASRPTPTSTPTATPEPEPDSDGDGVPDSEDDYPDDRTRTDEQVVVLNCYDFRDRFVYGDTLDPDNPDFSDAWRSDALATALGLDCYFDDDASTVPTQALDAAMFTLCLTPSAHWEGDLDIDAIGFSEMRVDQAEKALDLCPNHPEAESLRQRIAEVRDLALKIEQGILFRDGLYRVGDEIQPGSYYVENATDCYWERQDSAGAIIENYFGTALRVETQIDPSDYAFRSQGCGLWKPSE